MNKVESVSSKDIGKRRKFDLDFLDCGDLSPCIVRHPEPLDGKRIGDCQIKVLSVNDKRMVIGAYNYTYLIYFILTAFFSLVLIYELKNSDSIIDLFTRGWMELLGNIVLLIASFFNFLSVLGMIFRWREKVVLNRENTSVTYPRLFFFRKKRSFLDCGFRVTSISGSSKVGVYFAGRSSLPRFFMTLRHCPSDSSKKPLFKRMVVFGWDKCSGFSDVRKMLLLMSLINWYMDKNRPLPPGKLFDEFRLVDFEYRKQLNFPKPLFPSDFPIPDIDGIEHSIYMCNVPIEEIRQPKQSNRKNYSRKKRKNSRAYLKNKID